MSNFLYKYPENARIFDRDCNHIPFEVEGRRIVCEECDGFICDICGTHFFIMYEKEENNE